MRVFKFGGASVKDAEGVRNVVEVLKETGHANTMLVVSAMGKTTDELVNLAREVTPRPPRREMDMLLHAGEIISSSLLARAIAAEGESAVALTGSQAGMITDSSHT